QGSLMLNSDGSFSYTPAAGYSGPDSFSYKANDGSLDSNVATVNVTVNPSLTLSGAELTNQNVGGDQYLYDFGSVLDASQTFTVTNHDSEATDPLIFAGPIGGNGFIGVTNNTCIDGQALGAGATCSFTLTWHIGVNVLCGGHAFSADVIIDGDSVKPPGVPEIRLRAGGQCPNPLS